MQGKINPSRITNRRLSAIAIELGRRLGVPVFISKCPQGWYFCDRGLNKLEGYPVYRSKPELGKWFLSYMAGWDAGLKHYGVRQNWEGEEIVESPEGSTN